VLRLLPISGGIFAGAFKQQIPALTRDALGAAFRTLLPEEREALRERVVHLCIFMGGELPAWAAAGWRVNSAAIDPRQSTYTTYNNPPFQPGGYVESCCSPEKGVCPVS
jgi:hypothetical protein